MSGASLISERPADWLHPTWADPGVDALMTSRNGGISKPPFDSLNLRPGLGDDDAAVAANLQTLESQMNARPVWLNQVHGIRVRRLHAADARPGAPVHQADASVSTVPGLACMIQVADCLPVLMSARGRAVAAAHAGWRGLAGGILGATVADLCEAAECPPEQIEAWLGACIGPGRFEVGHDVLSAFGVDPQVGSPRFTERGAGFPEKWLADLPGLAADCLRAVGVHRIRIAGVCTVDASSQFFSYRRDGVTGRMAAGIWLARP